MITAALQRSLARTVALELEHDHAANRCHIITELHGDVWRIHATGPRKIDGEIRNQVLVREYGTRSDMIGDLSMVACEFYNI